MGRKDTTPAEGIIQSTRAFADCLAGLLIRLATEDEDFSGSVTVATTTDCSPIGCAVVDQLVALGASEGVFVDIAFRAENAPVGVAALERITSLEFLTPIARGAKLDLIRCLATARLTPPKKR